MGVFKTYKTVMKRNNKRGLWLDDERTPPDESWDWAKTGGQAVIMLAFGDYETVSLDHDLGDSHGVDGRHVLDWLDETSWFGGYVPMIEIHTMNASERASMTRDASVINLRRSL